MNWDQIVYFKTEQTSFMIRIFLKKILLKRVLKFLGEPL
jgi:hypothetical protein